MPTTPERHYNTHGQAFTNVRWTHDDTAFQTVYCYSCSSRTTYESLRECVTCEAWVCTTGECMNRHDHSGIYCNDCGHNTLSTDDDTRFCGFHDEYYCGEHAHDHEDCGAREEDYAYRDGSRPRVDGYGREASMDWIDADYVYDPRALGKRAVAFEIEAEYVGNNREGELILSPRVGVGDDGSLSNGIEVTTPPSRGKTLADGLTETMGLMIEGGYDASLRSCGLHTHFDLRDKKDDKKFLAHLFNAFFAVEDVFYAMQMNDRSTGSYSVPLRNSYKFFDMYGQLSGDFDYTFYKQPKDHNGQYTMQREKERKYASPRYATFNFHSVYFRGSLEVRLHEGTLDAKRALMWADLMQSIIARVEKGHSYKTMIELAKMPVSIEKVNRMSRYFGLSKDQKAYIVDRINRGQGFGYSLRPIQWGTPVKGRPKRHDPVRPPMNLVYVGQRVSCFSCMNQWTLRRTHRNCPNCSRPLMNVWNERNYNRIITVPRRTRSSVRANEWYFDTSASNFGFEPLRFEDTE